MADSFYESTLALAASAARGATAGTNGTAFETNGKRVVYNVVLDVTAKATEVSDTCDVYVDVLVGDMWVNVVHFTQLLGNGTDAERQTAMVAPMGGATAVTDVTASAASGVVRPGIIGASMRERHVIVDGGGAAASFTFSVTAYAL